MENKENKENKTQVKHIVFYNTIEIAQFFSATLNFGHTEYYGITHFFHCYQ